MEQETKDPVLFCPSLNTQEVLMGNCPLLVLTPWLVGSVGKWGGAEGCPFSCFTSKATILWF